MSDEVRAGRPEAAAAIWDWKGDGGDRAARAAKARKGAVLRAVVGGAAGALFFFALARPIFAGVVWGISGLTLLLGLASPLGAYAAIDRLVMAASRVVGTALTWLLLTPVYLFFFAPFGWLFKRGRRDPMRRAFDRDADSYWSEHDEKRSLDKPY